MDYKSSTRLKFRKEGEKAHKAFRALIPSEVSMLQLQIQLRREHSTTVVENHEVHVVWERNDPVLFGIGMDREELSRHSESSPHTENETHERFSNHVERRPGEFLLHDLQQALVLDGGIGGVGQDQDPEDAEKKIASQSMYCL